jgi:hypothetical protein
MPARRGFRRPGSHMATLDRACAPDCVGTGASSRGKSVEVNPPREPVTRRDLLTRASSISTSTVPQMQNVLDRRAGAGPKALTCAQRQQSAPKSAEERLRQGRAVGS